VKMEAKYRKVTNGHSAANHDIESNGKSHGPGSHNNGTKHYQNGNGHPVSNGLTPGSNNHPASGSRASNLLHYTIIPTILIIFCSHLVIAFTYIVIRCDGSIVEFFTRACDTGLMTFYFERWSAVRIISPFTASLILGYAAWALLLMVLVPGRRVNGPITPKGHTPIYKDNGLACFLITMVGFAGLAAFLKFNGYQSPTIVYDRFEEIMATLTFFSFIVCVGLYVKGHLWPTTSDSGSSGNVIFDFFWGMELYPRVCGVDIKVFTNCRFGLTVWALLVCIFTMKSYEKYGFVDSAWLSAALQLIYLTKFYMWESGYMRTIDIMMDRAGYYICYGCLSYVPGIYASVSLYLVNQPTRLGWALSFVVFTVGVASCLVNYLADLQKQDVRKTKGNCSIWGRKPELITARYQLEDGTMHENLLLVSGYWKLARHFHYVPELCLALCWSIPAGFNHLIAYTYFISLFFLLLHRTYRDDYKCRAKYGKYWDEYCQWVPYKIIPYLF